MKRLDWGQPKGPQDWEYVYRALQMIREQSFRTEQSDTDIAELQDGSPATLLTTRGDLIRRGASAPERVALGTALQFLGSDGTDALWQSPYGKLLTSGTFSAASTLDIVLTSYTAYRAIKFVLTNVTPSADGPFIYVRTSSNGGSSYDAAASDYAWDYRAGTGTDGADAQINTGAAPGNAAGENTEFELTLFNQAGALHTIMSWEGGYVWTDGTAFQVTGAGARLSAADVDAIRFLPSTGTFSGKYAVYGVP